jgi:dTDP-4-dehydrorhamnose 3,5-epimerase
LNCPLSGPIPSEASAQPESGLLGATRDHQSITHDWQPVQPLIAGIEVREVRNVIKDNGYLTEIWRADWGPAPAMVAQVFQVVIEAHGISAWHVHEHVTDRLFANHGLLKIVLFDARPASSTMGRVNVFRCGTARSMLIVVPPGVWHGVQNLSAERALLLNLPDRAYQYASPDHWRLPPDTDRIPYSFASGARPDSEDPDRL